MVLENKPIDLKKLLLSFSAAFLITVQPPCNLSPTDKFQKPLKGTPSLILIIEAHYRHSQASRGKGLPLLLFHLNCSRI